MADSSLPCGVRRHGGKLRTSVRGSTFEVDARYEVIKRIGQGAYGMIAEARDHVTGDLVAIKKIRQAFEHETECKRSLREMRLLQHFHHENILQLRDIMLPPPGEWSDLYLVYERMDVDLHYVIHSSQSITNGHIRWFTYQIMRGLAAIHEANVLHRDLKPSNILVNRNCDVKICDFGFARGVNDPASPERPGGPHSPLTEYVVTRWYRAPELLVQNSSYGRPIDLWSVGCILAELLGRGTLFAGKDYLNQLKLIVDRLGAGKTDLETIENDNAREYVRALATKGPRIQATTETWATLFPGAEPAAHDLLANLLVFDSRPRLSAADALTQHAYLRDMHEDNPASTPTRPFEYGFEACGVVEADLKALVWRELVRFHPEVGETPRASFIAGVVPMATPA